MYKYVLLPGRHHAVTRFQTQYIHSLLKNEGQYKTLDKTEITLQPDAKVVWAITSANHSNTRRNPISGARRLGIIEAIAASELIPSLSFLIPNMEHKKNFAHYNIEEIYLQSRGRVRLTPENCLVACSTPDVIAQYEVLGFSIASVELVERDSEKMTTLRPWDVVEELISSGADWRSNSIVAEELDPICLAHYENYGLGDLIAEVFEDPLVSSEGDITDTRDYTVYRQAFEDNAFRKVDEFADKVLPGRILDIGCATGQTLKLLTEKPELFESDFYGVEAARPLYEICEQRKNNGEFGGKNVFFYQRNIMRSSLFPRNSLNTTITMALTHEIESYLGREALLEFIQRMYNITAPGGVYINYDVVAPTNKDEEVHVLFTTDDGENPSELYPKLKAKDLSTFLGSLSTKARFTRFVQDFRHDEGDTITMRQETVDKKDYTVLRYGDLCDFLAKKDYIDSWHSEMHERFCFWELADWKKALEKVGFQLDPASKTIQNPWLITNRFAPAAQVFTKRKNGALKPKEQPETNVLIVANKSQ